MNWPSHTASSRWPMCCEALLPSTAELGQRVDYFLTLFIHKNDKMENHWWFLTKSQVKWKVCIGNRKCNLIVLLCRLCAFWMGLFMIVNDTIFLFADELAPSSSALRTYWSTVTVDMTFSGNTNGGITYDSPFILLCMCVCGLSTCINWNHSDFCKLTNPVPFPKGRFDKIYF